MCEEVSIAHSWCFFLSAVYVSDADDEGASTEAERSSSEAEGSNSEDLLNEGSTSEELGSGLSQQLTTSYGAVLDKGFDMEGYDQQTDIIPGYYMIEEEVWYSPFNVCN